MPVNNFFFFFIKKDGYHVSDMLGREEMEETPEGSDSVATTSPVTVTTTTGPTPPPPPQQKSTSVSLAPRQPTAFVPPTPLAQRQTTVPEPSRQPDTMVPPPPQKITVPAIQPQQLATTQQTVTLSFSTLSSSSTSSSSSWPSGDWILEAVEKIKASAKARRKGSESDFGDTVDYDEDDGGDDGDDYGNDEIEEIEEPAFTPTDASIVPATAHPSPRLAAGHMSRYQFKRIDGRPDDGRVNGTYVAVVESDRPSRDVINDPVSVKRTIDGFWF